MDIGLYDHNLPGLLSKFLGEVERNGTELKRYGDLPLDGESDLPSTFIIQPIFSLDEDYWARVRGCIEAHPGTRFLIVTSWMERSNIEFSINGDGLDNLEYVGFDGIRDLGELLGD